MIFNQKILPSYHFFNIELRLESIPSTLDRNQFEIIDVFGRSQITYKGWPLYYFGQDAERGETKGVSVPAAGVWPVIFDEIDPASKAVSTTNVLSFDSTVPVYPNPFSAEFSIKLNVESIKKVNIQLFNSQGQRLYSLSNYPVIQGSNIISLSNLEGLHSGLYWLSIDGDQQAILSLPIIKK